MRQAHERAAVTVGADSESCNQTESMQPYLQNKAELSTEGRGSEISPPEEGIFELMDRNQYQELPGEELQESKSSFGERHELRGEEHAMELDSSPSRQDPYRYSFDVPNFGDLKQSALTARPGVKDTAYENRYHLGLLPILSLKVRVGEFIEGCNAFVDEDSIRCHHARMHKIGILRAQNVSEIIGDCTLRGLELDKMVRLRPQISQKNCHTIMEARHGSR